MYPNIKYPACSNIFNNLQMLDIKGGKYLTGQNNSGGPSFIEDRRKSLQSYLQELSLIPIIKESHQFKSFLGVDEQFPELKDSIKDQQVTFANKDLVQNRSCSTLSMKLEEMIEEGIQQRMHAHDYEVANDESVIELNTSKFYGMQQTSQSAGGNYHYERDWKDAQSEQTTPYKSSKVDTSFQKQSLQQIDQNAFNSRITDSQKKTRGFRAPYNENCDPDGGGSCQRVIKKFTDFDEISNSDCPSFQKTSMIPSIEHSHLNSVHGQRQSLQPTSSKSHLILDSTKGHLRKAVEKHQQAKRLVQKQKETCIAYCQQKLMQEEHGSDIYQIKSHGTRNPKSSITGTLSKSFLATKGSSINCDSYNSLAGQIKKKRTSEILGKESKASAGLTSKSQNTTIIAKSSQITPTKEHYSTSQYISEQPINNGMRILSANPDHKKQQKKQSVFYQPATIASGKMEKKLFK